MDERLQPSGDRKDGADPGRSWPPALAGVVLIIAVLAVWYALPEFRYVQVHDFLDSNHARLKVLAEHDLFFAPLEAVVPPLMNGVPRDALQSQFKLLVPAYLLLEPVAALILNEILSRLLAFFCFFLLFRAHFRAGVSPWIASGISALYALLPVYPGDPYAQPIMPLGLWAALNIADRRHPIGSLLVFALLPWAGAFPFSGPACGALALAPLILSIGRRRRPHWAAWLAPVVLVAGYVATDYRIFHLQLLQSDYVSHRVERFHEPEFPGKAALEFAGHFLFGQYHFPSLHMPVILATVALGVAVAWKAGSLERFQRMVLLLVACAVISAVSALHEYLRAYPEFFHTIGLGQLASLHYGRVYGLSPLLWHLLFALSLQGIGERLPRNPGRWALAVILILQFAVVWRGSHWNTTRERYGVTISEFYSEALFEEIRNYIGEDPSTYRVISVGLFPTIALYHGFYCLDGYLPSYALDYKKEFRKVIAPELEKSEVIRDYFDHWGSRAYAFSSELSKNFFFTRDRQRRLSDWSFNVEAFRNLGGRYVISAVAIEPGPQNGLVLEQRFERKGSPWRIWLYRTRAPSDPGSSPPDVLTPELTRNPEAESAIDFEALPEHDPSVS